MVHPNPNKSFVNHLLYHLILCLFALSTVGSIAVPLDVPRGLAQSPATSSRKSYPSKQKSFGEPPSEFVRAIVLGQEHSLLTTNPSSSIRQSTEYVSETSTTLKFSSLIVSSSKASSVKMAIDTHAHILWVNTTRNYQTLETKQKTTLFNDSEAISWPLDTPEYSATVVTILTSGPIRPRLSNTISTSPYWIALSRTPIAMAQTNSAYLISVPSNPKLDATQSLHPTPTSSELTPIFDPKLDPTLASKFPSLPQNSSSSVVGHMLLSKLTYLPLPTIVGVTVHPAFVPEDLISTFFGGLGGGRTKEYVIPVNSNGVTGWWKAVATERAKVGRIGGEFVKPNQVPGSTAAPGFPSRQKVSSIMVGDSIPQNTIYSTPLSNTTYNDSLKIAAIQAFSQIGVVLLALLIVVAAAVVFICCSSILKWPMRVMHALRFRDINTLKDLMVPSKLRKRKVHKGKKMEGVEGVGNTMRGPDHEKRYLRGTAEAVMVDNSSSSRESVSNMSVGSFDEESSESAVSVSIGTSVEGAWSGSVPTVAAISSGSQSKAEGSRMRVTNRNSSSV